MKPQEIGIDHEALAMFRFNLDGALQVVTKVMMARKIVNGTVNAKINIKIQEFKDENGEIYRMMVLEPDVRMKIGSKDQFKCDKIGGLYVKTDDEGKVIVADNQISMEEYMNDQKGA